MTESKRGRPKKDSAPSKPLNPDCEVATKAYVKCLVSSVRPHIHDVHDECEPPLFTIVATAFGWLILLVFASSSTPDGIAARAQWGIPLLLVTAAMTIHLFDKVGSSMMTTGIVNNFWRDSERDPKILKPYKEPECEPKKPCE